MARTPRDLADRMAARRRQAKADDGYARETFTQPREQARRTARAFLNRWPAGRVHVAGRVHGASFPAARSSLQ